jgi:hypothetical protein
MFTDVLYCLFWLAHPNLRRSALSIALMTLTMMLNHLKARQMEGLPPSLPNGFRALVVCDDKFII